MRCSFTETYPGPHPGCSEFAPDDVFECSTNADRLVWLPPTEAYDPPDGTVLAVCAAHDPSTARGLLYPAVAGTEVAFLTYLPLHGCGEPIWFKHPDEHARCSFCAQGPEPSDHPGCSCPAAAAYDAAMAESAR